LAKGKPDLLHGTLELLILKTLSAGPLHGWAIAKHIQQISNEVLEVGQGSLYPALYRLEDRDWIRSEWGISGSGRRAKFYTLTRRGVRQLASEEEQWKSFSGAVDRVLGHS
jgi:transcriptional regulator